MTHTVNPVSKMFSETSLRSRYVLWWASKSKSVKAKHVIESKWYAWGSVTCFGFSLGQWCYWMILSNVLSQVIIAAIFNPNNHTTCTVFSNSLFKSLLFKYKCINPYQVLINNTIYILRYLTGTMLFNPIELRLGNSIYKCPLGLQFKNCPHGSVEWLHDERDWPRKSR